MPSEYDERLALRSYVWQHCTDQMTEEERRVGQAISLRGKLAHSHGDTYIAEKFPWAFSPEMDATLKDGPEAYLDGVVGRVLPSVEINRCPACDRVVRTPVARLCLWCGHDWRAGGLGAAGPQEEAP